MISYLANFQDLWGPLRLFQFLTFRCALAALFALAITFIFAPYVLRKLRALKVQETGRDAAVVGRLADLHASKKSIPSMGGLLIALAIIPSVLICASWNTYVFVALIIYAGLTVVGFADDFLKVKKQNSAGLNSKWKLAAQTLLTFVAVGILLWDPNTHLHMSELWVPFYKEPLIAQMPIWFIFIFFFFVMAGSSNAINLTDGVDGLAIGCTIPSVLVYSVFAYISGHAVISKYLYINYIPGAGELAVVCAAVMGAGLGFLWYNSHPAEVFMGDTGSLGLGGLIGGSVAFMVHEPFTLILVGGIFVIEASSVILQIASFRLTGKRIFRMAPIHHHFELKNWHESKVVIRFWILSLIFALIGLATLKLR